jgi:excisionase family DNA binding protein
MTDQPWTMSVPEAARKYFDIKSKDAAYAAAHAGVIPTIRVGRLLRVPRAVLEKQLSEKQSAA